jgi:hypothetical protein
MDDHGILYQSTEDEIRAVWGKRHDSNEFDNIVPRRQGDLKLIEIHEVDK